MEPTVFSLADTVLYESNLCWGPLSFRRYRWWFGRNCFRYCILYSLQSIHQKGNTITLMIPDHQRSLLKVNPSLIGSSTVSTLGSLASLLLYSKRAFVALSFFDRYHRFEIRIVLLYLGIDKDQIKCRVHLRNDIKGIADMLNDLISISTFIKIAPL